MNFLPLKLAIRGLYSLACLRVCAGWLLATGMIWEGVSYSGGCWVWILSSRWETQAFASSLATEQVHTSFETAPGVENSSSTSPVSPLTWWFPRFSQESTAFFSSQRSCVCFLCGNRADSHPASFWGRRGHPSNYSFALQPLYGLEIFDFLVFTSRASCFYRASSLLKHSVLWSIGWQGGLIPGLTYFLHSGSSSSLERCSGGGKA